MWAVSQSGLHALDWPDMWTGVASVLGPLAITGAADEMG